MSARDRLLEEAAERIRSETADALVRAEPYLKHKRRVFKKWIKVAALLLGVTIVIPIAMISGGFLLGPYATEGLVATPMALITAWAAILYGAFRPRALPRNIAKVDIAQLPAQTEEWLVSQRSTLPSKARGQVDNIAQLLEALGAQVQTLDPQTPQAAQVRRLIGEELPELVRGYQRVPRAFQQKPMDGGPSPERQLEVGLAAIEEEIGRVHSRLATGDLHALATQQRFLETKYKRDRDLE